MAPKKITQVRWLALQNNAIKLVVWHIPSDQFYVETDRLLAWRLLCVVCLGKEEIKIVDIGLYYIL